MNSGISLYINIIKRARALDLQTAPTVKNKKLAKLNILCQHTQSQTYRDIWRIRNILQVLTRDEDMIVLKPYKIIKSKR